MAKIASSLFFHARAPASLLFAIAAILHAAPLAAVRFAGVDEVDIAVRRAAFPDAAMVGLEE